MYNSFMFFGFCVPPEAGLIGVHQFAGTVQWNLLDRVMICGSGCGAGIALGDGLFRIWRIVLKCSGFASVLQACTALLLITDIIQVPINVVVVVIMFPSIKQPRSHPLNHLFHFLNFILYWILLFFELFFNYAWACILIFK